MEYELTIDPKAICRVCLAENTLKTVFCNEIVNGSILPFPKVFECVTGLKAVKDDGYPDKLCSPCRLIINDAYVLQQKCKHNQTLLSGILNIAIPEPAQCQPKVCQLAVGTQTDLEPKGDLLDECTQTAAREAKTIHTQTQRESKSIGSQTKKNYSKRSTNAVECQTDAWSPELAQIKTHSDEDNNATASRILSTIPEALSDDGSVLVEMADILEDCKPSIDAELSNHSVAMVDETDEDLEENVEYLMDDDDEFKVLETNSQLSGAMSFCKVCLQMFGSSEELERHAIDAECGMMMAKSKRTYNRSSSNKPRNICKLCKHNAKSAEDLTHHQQMHRQTVPMLLDSVYYFRCGTCNALFMTVNDLDEHLTGTGRTPCNKCETNEFCTNYQFLEDDDDDRLMSDGGPEDANHIDALQRICSTARIDDGSFMCHWCLQFEASSVLAIWEHFSEAHFQPQTDGDDGEPSSDDDARATYCESFSAIHKCGYCAETFRWLKDAIPHVYFHSCSFLCPFPGCPDSYLKFHLLNNHMERKHLDVDKHSCEHCKLELNSYAQKQTHMRHDCKQRPFACGRCDKKFYTRNNLALHSKFHMNERRFKCSFCDKRFTQSGDVKTHERIHTGDKPYQCNVCDKSFRSVGNRRDHIATHADVDAPKVKCKICEQSFKSERILRGHMAIHDPDKRFKCPVCNKEFYRKYHLKKHCKTHDYAINLS